MIGCFHIAQTTIQICCCKKKVNQEDPITNASPNIKVVTIIQRFFKTVVLLVKIIGGSYFLFTGWKDWNNAGRPSCSSNSDDIEFDCCAPQVIYFAFVIQVLLYVIAALLCLYVFYRLCCLSVNKTESVERA